MKRVLYPEESYAILGACFAVYKELGGGFLESVYQECLAMELRDRDIPFTSQHPLTLHYRGRQLEQHYVADFVCYGKILLELKAISNLADAHRAQVLNYLNATRMELGLLLNFGHYPLREYERIALSSQNGAPNE